MKWIEEEEMKNEEEKRMKNNMREDEGRLTDYQNMNDCEIYNERKWISKEEYVMKM